MPFGYLLGYLPVLPLKSVKSREILRKFEPKWVIGNNPVGKKG